MKNLLCLSLVFISFNLKAQIFTTKEYIDIGNIKASMGVHGNLWLDADSLTAACEFPKGSGKNIHSSGGLWIGGYNGNNMHVSAHKYLGSANGYNATDFWPGPVVDILNPQVSYAESQKWAKVWKVNRTEVNNFLSQPTHTLNNTPTAILEWPGEGNTYAKGNGGVSLFVPMKDYSRSFAPYVDVNNNGTYDPLSGDYPEIIGDQALWCVYNDMGNTHDLTNAQPLGVEIRCLAYAYHRNSNVDNIVFYKYEIINRVGLVFDSVCVGFFDEGDLGSPFDDYIGFDSTKNLAITYNASPVDGSGEPTSYGSMLPITGVSIVDMPGMNCSFSKPANSFMTFASGSSVNAYNAPQSAMEYYYFMTSRFKNGQHLRNDYTIPGSPSTGLGNGPNANYLYNGDPSDITQWSECAAQNAGGDRHSIFSFKLDGQITSGQTITVSYALLVTNPDTNNGCPTVSFAKIRELADTALKVYCDPLPINTTNVFSINKKSLSIYPNPASDELILELPVKTPAQVIITDMLGKTFSCKYTQNQNKINANISALPHAVYTATVICKDGVYTNKFTKQ